MKCLKIVSIMCLFIILFTVPSFASLSWSDIKDAADKFILRGENGGGSLISGSDMNALIERTF